MSAAAVVALLVGVAVLCWPAPARVRARTAALSGAAGEPRAPRRRATGPDLRRLLRRLRLRTRGEEEVLHLLDALAAALRTGLPPVAALEVVAEGLDPAQRRRWVAPVLRVARDGRGVGPVWDRLARTTGTPELAALGRAWGLSEAHGVPLAAAAASAARTSRDRQEHRRKVTTATAAARATAGLLTLLPLATPLLALLVGVAPGRLYASPIAVASTGAGLGLLVLGRLIVARMVRRAEAVAR